jgi:DNA polymerase-4
MSAYTRASDAVFEVFRHTTPVVEAVSVDEAFLDVVGLHRVSGTPVQTVPSPALWTADASAPDQR